MMKIAVLLEPFNAHIAVMKSTVEALQADKGLLVAANGKFLRKLRIYRITINIY